MCGISGFFRPSGFHPEEARQAVRKIANTLTHRGPDDSGEWVDGDYGIALGHRRLSILDLSAAGYQPMISASGRYVMVFNGEIYNHLDIRKDIGVVKQVPWRGHSDTEVLLAGFDHWGIEETLKKTVGMFAFALWDRQDRVLTLARDRMGEKPLYYGWQGDVFMFGSELRALRAHPAFKSDIDRQVLPLYLQHGYIPAPHSIYRGICKLLPGTFLEISGAVSRGSLPEPRPYWSLREVAEAGISNPFTGSDQEIIDELEARVMQAVSLQSVADVPLGAFLSGGIDSSLVVALMQAQSMRPVKTFTIGFYEQSYNEALHAESVAKHLGTDHTTLYVSSKKLLEIVPHIHELYDEPFSDSSASMLVSKLARQEVKVSLSGDGGDESFGGYDGYRRVNSLWRKYQIIPSFLRPLISKSVLAFSPTILTGLLTPLLRLAGRNTSTSIPFGQRLHKLAMGLQYEDPIELFWLVKSHGGVERTLIRNHDSVVEVCREGIALPDFKHIYNSMMYWDSVEYLPDDILVKVDRAAMSVSLETRAPLLDHRVVEFAWQLPGNIKIRGGQGKWPLQQVLQRYVPKTLVDRPKMGFNLPIAEWIRGPLRSWSEDLLSEDRLLREGYFESENVRKMLKEHILGQHNWYVLLLRLIAFQSWLGKTSA